MLVAAKLKEKYSGSYSTHEISKQNYLHALVSRPILKSQEFFMSFRTIIFIFQAHINIWTTIFWPLVDAEAVIWIDLHELICTRIQTATERPPGGVCWLQEPPPLRAQVCGEDTDDIGLQSQGCDDKCHHRSDQRGFIARGEVQGMLPPSPCWNLKYNLKAYCKWPKKSHKDLKFSIPFKCLKICSLCYNLHLPRIIST